MPKKDHDFVKGATGPKELPGLDDRPDSEDPIFEDLLAAQEAVVPNLWERRTAERKFIDNRRDAQDSRVAVAQYVSALKDGVTMKGTIAAVDESGEEPCWMIYDNNVQIQIPFKDTFDLENDNDIKRLQSHSEIQAAFLQRAVGAQISYAVTNIQHNKEDNHYIVTGSRVLALRKFRRRYYKMNDNTVQNPLEVGDIVSVPVISAGPYACYVEVNGIDTRIANKDLTYRYVPDVAETFPPGSMVDVKVMRIDTSGKIPAVFVSGTAVERSRLSERHYRVKENMTTTATVKSVRLTNGDNTPFVTIALYLDNIELPGFTTSSQVTVRDKLHSGTKVVVKVLGIAQDSGFVRCRITKILSDKLPSL